MKNGSGLARGRIGGACRLSALLLLAHAAVAAAAQYGDFTYTSDGAAVTITRYSGTNSVVSIPALIGGLPVTCIGDSAFSGGHRLTAVAIPGGVTNLGNYAFQNCFRLTGVTIPDSVTSLGSGAFWNCGGLTSVSLGGGVTRIEGDTFALCTNLPSVTIPNGVTWIRDNAFMGCARLASVTIGSGVTILSSMAFADCTALAAYVVNPANTVFSGVDGLLYNKSGTGLIQCPRGKSGDVALPTVVTNIGSTAFAGCAGLAGVTIPSGVTSPMSSETFRDCSRLTAITVNAANALYSSVDGIMYNKGFTTLLVCPAGKAGSVSTIPATVVSISPSAFTACAGLTGITLPSAVRWIGVGAFNGCGNLTALDIPPGVTAVESGTFYGCSRLARVTIPSTVTRIDYAAFYGCSALLGVTIPAGVTVINESTFANCSSLTNMVIPRGVSTIWDWAFYGCSRLTLVAIPEGVAWLGYQAFKGCSSLAQVTIPGTVDYFGENVFSGCSNLTDVTIANGVSMIRIGGLAFEGCSRLARVTIGNGVTSIGYEAFRGCTQLASIVIPASVTSIEAFAFFGCSGLSGVLTIPNGTIDGGAFFGCSRLTAAVIGSGVTGIADGAFSRCTGMRSITVAPGNTAYRSVDGILYDAAATTLIQCPEGRTGSTVVIPGGVTVIGGSAFSLCTNVTSVTIPGSLTTIGNAAFANCYGLTTLRIPASVTSIEDYAFRWCANLTSVYFDGNAPTLGGGSVYEGAQNATLYYLAGATGWASYVGGRPTVMVTPQVTLGAAVDDPVGAWTTGGAQPWFSQASITCDRTDAVQSGPIGNGQQSWMQTVVNGPTSVGFWWKTSSEVSDMLSFTIDGVPQLQSGGPVDWHWDGYYVATGVHTLRWTYAKNGSAAVDNDAVWVDGVSIGLFGEAYPLGGGWVWSDWFGIVSTSGAPWLYHNEHAWLYPFGQDPRSVVFWDGAMNAFWWTGDLTYPYLYRFSDNAWLWYQRGTTRPRVMLNMKTGAWERR